MDRTDNASLLRDYAKHGCEPAFAELVRRHIDLVYSVALRRTGGEVPLAEDVAQKVFTDLAVKAQTLPAQTMLAGWLYRHTCFVAATLIRTEARRRHREQVFVEMKALQENSPPDWAQLAPVLEDAMQELSDLDREALLLRFFQQQPLRAVGATLGVSEDAAWMRVDRALARLRGVLARRGIHSTAEALAVTITAHAVTAAPIGLAASVAAGALSTTAAGVAGLKTLTLMTLTKTQAVAFSALLVAGAAVPIWQHVQNTRLAAQNVALRAQSGQLVQARAKIKRLNSQLQKTQAEPSAEHEELLRLRGQIGVLREENARLNAQRGRPAQPLQKDADVQASGKGKNQAEQNADQLRIAKMNFLYLWGKALRQFAEKNNGLLPSSLGAARPYLDTADAAHGASIQAQAARYGLRADQYQLTYHGPLKLSSIGDPPNTILVRERQPHQSNGAWERAYLFADGHAEIHTEHDGTNFANWEKGRLPSPGTP